MTFQELGIIPSILNALKKEGYESPTPIQEQAIPPVLKKKDLLGCAQTGTGKTAAFAVPILQLLVEQGSIQPRKIRSLILTPTRELALQIQESFEAYSRFLPLKTCVIFGGVPQNPQVQQLKRGIDILVATPGRLNDLIGQGFIKLQDVQIFVLDEADRMLDMGFIHDVKRVIEKLPKKRQNLLFSATMPKEIEELADTILRDPAKVTVTPPATTVEAIEQSVYFVDKENKRRLLIHLLQNPEIESALVFTRTKHGADRVVRELTKAKVSASAIHGDKSQNARQKALGDFKQHRTRVLVATDIAARGIDIEELSHVINYDIPEVPETYVHRIGRTGRAGLSGIAISFCDINEKADFSQVEKLIGKKVPVVEDHPYPMLITVPTPKSELRRNRGQRPAAQQASQQQPRGQKAAQPPQAQQRSQRAAQSQQPRNQKAAQPQQRKPAPSPIQKPAFAPPPPKAQQIAAPKRQAPVAPPSPKAQQARTPKKQSPMAQSGGRKPIEAMTEFPSLQDVLPEQRPTLFSKTEGGKKPRQRREPVPGGRGMQPRPQQQKRAKSSPPPIQRTEPVRKRPVDQPLGQTRFGGRRG